jgi:hypothetical protein
MGLQGFIEQHLSNKETEEFATWAIGDKFKQYKVHDWPPIWNEKHGHLFKIDKNNSPWKDLPKMIEIWKNYAKMAC